MKNTLFQWSFFVIFIITAIVKCDKIENTQSYITLSKSNIETSTALVNLKKRDKHVLVKTFLLNSWLNLSQLHYLSYKELRQAMIEELAKRSAMDRNKLDKLSDNDLAWGALAYRFLLDSEIRTVDTLKEMLFSNFKEAIIIANAEHTTHSLPDKAISDYEHLRIAYAWWLPLKHASLIYSLNHVDANQSHFKLKDDRNKSTDVLRIVKADESDFKYLGVYHTMISKNRFKLSLAGSNDLKSWTFITNLGDRSHQGDIKKWGNGFLLVNEEDKEEGSNNIRVRFYTSYNKLCSNIPEYSTALQKKFSKYAEGTPDIRQIVGDSPAKSHVLIGFHYFNKGDVDYQAIGILKNFTHWKAWKDDISNKNIIKMGFNGNIGARASFKSYGNKLVIQEAQLEKYSFSKWRLLIGDGAFYTQLNLKTSKGATSFANPGIIEIEEEEFAVSTFLPSEGNRNQESGQLLYISKN